MSCIGNPTGALTGGVIDSLLRPLLNATYRSCGVILTCLHVGNQALTFFVRELVRICVITNVRACVFIWGSGRWVGGCVCVLVGYCIL